MLKNLQLLVLLFLFTCFSVNAQTTPITDTNFEQFLIDEGIDTNGANGNILDTDAQAVTALNVTRNDITDFTGLEAFVNIITLDLGRNQFASAPLTTLTFLEELEFTDNDALNSLNLTQNSALRILDIGSRFSGLVPHPPITNLDLSQNLNLESLDIFFFVNMSSLVLPVTNTLTEIDIYRLADPTLDFSDLDGLIDLRIRYSEVSTVITLPDVKTVIEEFEIQGIVIPTIDVSEYTSLVDVTFGSTDVETLLLPATSTLLSVDVQHHNLSDIPFSLALAPNLTDLKINYNDAIPLLVDISSNLELEDIDLAYNDMVSVDLSQNVKCTDLDVTGNELNVLNLTQNINLENLRAGYNQLPSLDLTQNTLLDRATLSHNQLPILDITQNTLLTSLYIDNNLFATTGLDLTQNSLLRSLVANNNQIESLNITQNLELSYFDISFNLFPGDDILQQFADLTTTRGRLFGALIANNNLLSGPIPDFYSLYDPAIQTRRFRLHLSENRFHFGDLEDQHLDLFGLTTTMSIGPSPDWVIDQYTYAPQAKVNTIDNPSRNAGENITFSTTVRGTQNHYKWFKDGVEIIDAPDAPEYTITDLNTCDAGVYHSEITSDLVPFENASAPGTNGRNLLLLRNDITLTVNATKECVTLDMPLTNVAINSGIQWNDTPGACGYKISVGTTSGATDLVNDLDVGEVTVYNHTSDFAPNQDIFVTITPYFDDGDFGGCTEESFRTNATAVEPDCTSLASPENGDTDVAIDITSISWNPANGADAYRIAITSTSGNNNMTLTDLGDVLTHPLPTSFQNGDVVTVEIVPYNTVDDAIGPCSVQSFTVGSATPSVPGGCADLASPLANATDVAVDVGSISWDAVADATGYRVSIDGSTSTVNDITDQDIAGTSFTLPGNFDNGETVSVTIVPFNTTGDAVGCDTPQSFTIVNATPSVPGGCADLASPLANATDVAVDIGSISWDSVADATGYRVSIDGSTSDTNDITDQDISGTSLTLPGNFDNGETVSVTIVPFNTAGDAVGCDAPQTFTIVNATPSVPGGCADLASPLANATDVAVDVGSISWDAVADVTGYRVSIDGSTSTVNDITDQDIAGTSFTLPGNFDNGETVSVTIVPFNTTGDAAGCDMPQTFTIVNATPSVPGSCADLASPLANATDVAIDIGSISWDAVADATGYRVSIDGSTSTVNDITDQDIAGTSFTLPGNFDNGETVSVTIVPFNTTGDAAGCDTPQIFTIVNATPSVPGSCADLASPLANATDVAIDIGSISWDAVADATGYRVSIDGSTSTVNDITDQDIAGTSFTLPGNFDNGETVSVTIVPFNTTGDALGCDTPQSFTIISSVVPILPECTELLAELNNATDVDVTTSIAWNAVNTAEGYYVSVRTDSDEVILPETDLGILTNYSLQEDLPFATTIFVSITPYNSEGRNDSCSELSFVTIEEMEEPDEPEEPFEEDETKYGFSPDGDGINEFWEIDGIENHPDNIVYIYNRWGDMVFQIEGYDNQSNIFRGDANNLNGLGADTLPAGTYFFRIQVSGETTMKKLTGYLVLKR